MELTNAVDVELAAAIGCHIQNSIRINQWVITSQKIQEKSQDFHTNEYFTRSKRTSRSTTSILSGQEKHQTEISQDSTSDMVDCTVVLPERCSKNKSTTKIRIPIQITVWKNKLDHLSFLFSAFCNGTISAITMYDNLHVEFRDLITFLCYTTSTKRPATVFAPVEVYAGSLIKLQQYCVVCTKNGSERLLYVAVHQVISFWLRFLHRKNLDNLKKQDRLWLHTRSVITRMFSNIIIQKCVLAIKHSLASMLKELTMLVMQSDEYSYGFYACEQIEHLLSVLSHQLPYVIY